MEINTHALLFADRIITEDNGKKGLIGVFTCFNFPGFPIQAPPWFVFVAMDNVPEGKHSFTVNINRDDSKQVVFSASGEFGVEGPDTVGELSLPIPSVAFPGDGSYLVTFLVDGRETAQRFLKVNLRQPKGTQNDR